MAEFRFGFPDRVYGMLLFRVWLSKVAGRLRFGRTDPHSDRDGSLDAWRL